ncbi:glycosyltransferase [Rossellomorea marisflavi]|uniref:glycosyltransferase n=1 Tax=Rossellomorea marisflavi TaxID=189381 RepID=UPI00279BC014|nr:glycosyltransferase [Rossellomorea marisflavi]UTE73411.1 glycosyltransferase [Rossellomorea marisflavi]
MKSILFVTKDLGSGGAEKSLVSLLSQLDYEKYSVDLLRLGEGDFFLQSIPDEVNLINIPFETNHLICKPAKESVSILFKKKKYFSLITEIIGHGTLKIVSNLTGYNSKLLKWRIVSPFIRKVNKEYDVAIAYNYDYPIHFIIDKVNSKKKIGWIHGNYNLTRSNPFFDKIYFSKLDNLVTVSKICKDILDAVFPIYSRKISVIENIISPQTINNLAVNCNYNEKILKDHFVIITVARLSNEKGIDLAIEAANILARKGLEFKWLIVGEGLERIKLEELIKRYDLIDKFILLGENSNPYPLIKRADLYVQPSLTEGKSIAIEEAKALGKPIVVTKYSTVTDQIKNMKNGLIVPIDPVAISNGIKRLMDSPKLRNEFKKELLTNTIGNESEINKLYTMMNNK